MNRVCGECAADISGRHWRAVFCESCAKIRKHRSWHAARSVGYPTLTGGWCAGSLAGLSQQARFCSDSCQNKRRYADKRAERLAAVKAYSASPAGKAMYHERRKRRRAQKRNVLVIPFTPTELARRMSMFAGCWMCGGEWNTVDHVKPTVKGGPHILANLRPACRSCNSSKNATWRGVRDALARAVVSR